MLNSNEHKYLKKQGQQFLENMNIYNTNFGFSKIQLPSHSQVESIMENMESMNKNENVHSAKNPNLDKYEKDFQKTLVEYNKAYQELNEDRLKKTQTLQKAKQYLGKVISEEDGNYYYVNNFGFTHKYSTDAWNKNNKDCPSNVMSANSNLFREGPDMAPGQPCHLAGKNIRNKDTNEAAWVDIKGFKHVYPENVWDKKSKTCSAKTINISDENYKLIPEDSPMTTTTVCDTMDINPNIWVHLKKLNKKLISLAQKMSREIEKMKIKDDVMRKLIDDQKKQLDIYVVNLDNDRMQLQKEKRTLITVSGEKENSELNMTANMYSYLYMFILAILSAYFTMKILYSNNISNKTILIVVLISVVGIYYIYNNMDVIM
jgi:hypothetical protein